MAVIPMGTANDFATAANIPQDPWEALQLAVQDTASPIDVGLVNNQVWTLQARWFCIETMGKCLHAGLARHTSCAERATRRATIKDELLALYSC